MEKGCGSAAIAGNGEAAGKLPPNPHLTCLRKISYARFGRSSFAAIRYQSATRLVSEDHHQRFGDNLCSIALCEEVRDENRDGLVLGLDAAGGRDTRASVLYEPTGEPDCSGR